VENFTPIQSLIGGLLIGLASVSMLYFVGRIAGISGIFGGILQAKHGETQWRIIFVLGLLAGGLFMQFFQPELLEFKMERSNVAIIIAGVLVGVGARLGNGCTSGHGVCGIGRMSPRSMIAVVTFMTSGAATAYVVNHLLGGNI